MVLNQQMTEKNSKDFYEKLIKIIGDWKPFTINYQELREKGWHQEFKRENSYVDENMKDEEEPYTQQYHLAWSTCPKKTEIINLIKTCGYFDLVPALETFKEITGIKDKICTCFT